MSNSRIVRNAAPVIPGIADSLKLSSGDTVFISGQIGFEEDGSKPATFERAVELGYRQLERALAVWGLDFSDLVRVNSYVKHLDKERLTTWRVTRDKVYGDVERSASTVIGVESLYRDAEFEIDAIAAL
ncbi:MAG: RidA family protein [Leucobacter sp.]|nr:RidA family protein [Leucobacter sp.]